MLTLQSCLPSSLRAAIARRHSDLLLDPMPPADEEFIALTEAVARYKREAGYS